MSSQVFPTLFVSHGAPTLAIEENDTTRFLKSLGKELSRPRAILCVSAHWGTRVPVVSAAERPETIHDFGGFPEELYRMRYPAPGAPELAWRALELLKEAGIESQVSTDRGLDHGAWIPLKLIYAEADVPVAQLSVQPQSRPDAHFRLGQALVQLRREGVLILATGSATHNLSLIGRESDWARQFDDWLYEKITHGAYDELLEYRRLAPHAEMAHPTDEHLLPLFVAAGAGAAAATGGRRLEGVCLHRGWTYGNLSMAAYKFGDGNAERAGQTEE